MPQDWRYYVGYALTDAEIKDIATLSTDEKVSECSEFNTKKNILSL
jgi:hypothetical protein